MWDSPMHLLIVAIVILILFGGRKIPELMRGLGEGVRGFKEACPERQIRRRLPRRVPLRRKNRQTIRSPSKERIANIASEGKGGHSSRPFCLLLEITVHHAILAWTGSTSRDNMLTFFKPTVKPTGKPAVNIVSKRSPVAGLGAAFTHAENSY